MKILVIGGAFNIKHGATKVVKELSKYLSKNNEIYVLPNFPLFCSQNIGQYSLLNKSINIYVLYIMVLNFHKVFFQIKKYVNKKNIIQYMFSCTYQLALFIYYSKKYKPEIVHIHGLILENYPIINYIIENKYACVVTTHGLYSIDDNINVNYKRIIEKDFFIKCNSNGINITSVSQKTKEMIEDNFNVKNTIVIPNGIDYEMLSNSVIDEDIYSKYRIDRNKKILLQVGSIQKRKNHELVMESIFKMDRNLKNNILYLVIGEGSEKHRLIEKSIKYNIGGQCIFTGSIPDNDLINIYKIADCFILPSTSEGFPMVFLEALSCGLPIIAYKYLEGVEELYSDECFQLFDEYTPECINRTINRALKKNWDKKAISINMRKWDWSNIACQYHILYQNIINNRL